MLDVQHDPGHVLADGNDASALGIGHPQDCRAAPANFRSVPSFQTLRLDAELDESTMKALEHASSAFGGSVRTRFSERFGRSYTAIDASQPVPAEALLQAIPSAALFDDGVIALAIEPMPTDALPDLAHALGGRGGPSGVRSAERVGDALIVEFSADHNPARFVLDIVDVELRRYNGHRRVELLTPAPAQWLARIAAEGLSAPEIDESRILEALLGRDA